MPDKGGIITVDEPRKPRSTRVGGLSSTRRRPRLAVPDPALVDIQRPGQPFPHAEVGINFPIPEALWESTAEVDTPKLEIDTTARLPVMVGLALEIAGTKLVTGLAEVEVDAILQPPNVILRPKVVARPGLVGRTWWVTFYQYGVWVPTATTLGVCNDNTNKFGQDVTVRSGRDGYFKFFPPQVQWLDWSLVEKIWLDMRVTTSEAETVNLDLFKIADAHEGWDPTTITCSNRPPADGAALQSVTWPWAVDSDHAQSRTIELNAAWVQRFKDRAAANGQVTILMRTTHATGITIPYEPHAMKDQVNINPNETAFPLNWDPNNATHQASLVNDDPA
jgi:hypothetical protein